MKKKVIVSLLLAFVMLFMAACSNSAQPASESQTPEPEPTAETEEAFDLLKAEPSPEWVSGLKEAETAK